MNETQATVTPTEQPAQRGRVASPRTVAIRSMLDETNGEVTFSVAGPLLQKLGHEVDQNTFNVTKSAWKKARQGETNTPKVRKVRKAKVAKAKAKKVNLPEVTIAEAIAFVTEAGGFAKAEADVLRRRAMLKAFKQLVKQTSKLAA